MNDVPNALMELMGKKPTRSGTSKRSAVRKIIDANADMFSKLADLGHTSVSVAEAFISSYPDVRRERQDLTDEDFKAHVAMTFVSFKRKLRKSGEPTTSKSQRAGRPARKKSSVEGRPHPAPAPQVQEKHEVAAMIDNPQRPTVIKPTSSGFPIPKAKDF